MTRPFFDLDLPALLPSSRSRFTRVRARHAAFGCCILASRHAGSLLFRNRVTLENLLKFTPQPLVTRDEIYERALKEKKSCHKRNRDFVDTFQLHL